MASIPGRPNTFEGVETHPYTPIPKTDALEPHIPEVKRKLERVPMAAPNSNIKKVLLELPTPGNTAH